MAPNAVDVDVNEMALHVETLNIKGGERRRSIAPQDSPRPTSVSHDFGVEKQWDLHLPKLTTIEEEAVLDEPTPNTFANAPSTDFMTRDVGYLSGSKKVKGGKKRPSPESVYSIVGVNVFRSRSHKLDHITAKIDSLKEHIAKASRMGDDDEKFPEFLVVTWLFKAAFRKEHTAVVHLFQRRLDVAPDAAFERALERFMAGDEKLRRNKFKFMFQVHDAPTALKKTVQIAGGERPVLIGKALKTTFHRGEKYLEINQDVGSSYVAQALNSAICKASASSCISTAWSLEAQEEDELPERLLGGVRWHFINVESVYLDLDKDFNLVQPKAT